MIETALVSRCRTDPFTCAGSDGYLVFCLFSSFVPVRDEP
jgi:hypothetical protein